MTVSSYANLITLFGQKKKKYHGLDTIKILCIKV